MARTNFRKTFALFVAASALAACASAPTPLSGKSKLTNQLEVLGSSAPVGMDPIATAAYWGTRYDRAPNDPGVAVAFSKALRTIGNNDEALRVMQSTTSRLGEDPELLVELGKALLANDRAHEAARNLQSAIVLGKEDDWTALSAYGVSLDKMGEHRQAIVQYDRALGLAPDQPQILNNKGLSYALAGKKSLAEQTLRTATAMPGGTARIRQNYALILALSGDTASAERLARSDLPPSVADGNVAYYRNLVTQPAYWQGLASGNSVQPDFGDDPSTVSLTPRSMPVPEPGRPALPARTPATQVPAPQPQPAPSVSASVGAAGEPSVAANSGPTVLPYGN